MAWVLMIIQIISAIPTLIKIVREILALIRDLPRDERKAAQDELTDIVKAAAATPVSSHQASRLEALLARLRNREA